MQQLNNHKNYRRRPTTQGNRPHHTGGNRTNHSGHKGEFRPADLAQLQMAAPVVTVGSKLYQQAVQRSEYYVSKAKEVMGSGDRFAAEGFLQHADHYGRIILEANELNREHKERHPPSRPVPSASGTQAASDESDGVVSASDEGVASAPSVTRTHRPRRTVPSAGTQGNAGGASAPHAGTPMRRAPRADPSAQGSRNHASMEKTETESLPLPPPIRLFSDHKTSDESAV